MPFAAASMAVALATALLWHQLGVPSQHLMLLPCLDCCLHPAGSSSTNAPAGSTVPPPFCNSGGPNRIQDTTQSAAKQ